MRQELKAYALAAVFLLLAMPSESALPPQRHIDADAGHQERVRVGAHKTWLKDPKSPYPAGVTLWNDGQLLTVHQFSDQMRARRDAYWR